MLLGAHGPENLGLQSCFASLTGGVSSSSADGNLSAGLFTYCCSTWPV